MNTYYNEILEEYLKELVKVCKGKMDKKGVNKVQDIKVKAIKDFINKMITDYQIGDTKKNNEYLTRKRIMG